MSGKIDSLQLLELLRRTYFGSVGSGVMEKMDKFSLTFIQRNVLLFIASHPGCIFSDVSKNFYLKNPSMTRIIYALEDKKLVVRSKGGDDMRKRFVHVTKKGKNLVSQLNREPIKKVSRMLENLSPAEQKAIVAGNEALVKGYQSITKKK